MHWHGTYARRDLRPSSGALASGDGRLMAASRAKPAMFHQTRPRCRGKKSAKCGRSMSGALKSLNETKDLSNASRSSCPTNGLPGLKRRAREDHKLSFGSQDQNSFEH